MNQMSLPYGGGPPAQSHSPTSVAAAESIKCRIGPLHKAIVDFLTGAQNVGATDEELQACLNMNPNTQRPRRRELELSGVIKASGQTRKTKSGRQAVVWVLS